MVTEGLSALRLDLDEPHDHVGMLSPDPRAAD
jgi:hypothetical protein